jgi:RIO kinase 1
LLLQHDLIHGDLSAYNILYWEGAVTLIDFPQVTSLRANQNARFILGRDIVRVCDYFGRQGISCDPQVLLRRLWSRYGAESEAEQASRRVWQEE